MDTNRRKLLKIGGLCALGIGALPVVNAFGKSDLPKVTDNRQALVAKRWAMVIDLGKCWEKGKPGCMDCVLACHVTHNVPDIGNRKEEIKWIWTETYNHVFPNPVNPTLPTALAEKPVMVLCNHCKNASCVRVCPTKATFKRPNGITMMDYHRCIGCRFCMAACPYGARSFNLCEPRPFIKTELNPTFPTREAGVVEKCNFCEERLATGLQPACVEACAKEAKAMAFGDFEDPNSEVRQILAQHQSIRRRPELGLEPSVFYLV